MTIDRRDLVITAIAGLALAGIGLFGAIGATSNAVYPSWPDVFDDVVGGPNILLVIGLAVFVAGLPLVQALHVRWPAHLRTRTEIRRWVMAVALRTAVAVALIVAACMVIWGFYVFGWVAPRSPDLVDPAGYGSPQEVAATVAGSHPLFALAGNSPVIFVALSALWASAHAGLITLMTSLSALLLRSRVMALLAPAAVLLGLSLAAELRGAPAMSPFIGWVYPGGLQPFDMGLAIWPGVVLLVVCVALLGVIVRKAPTLQRFA